MTYQNEIPIEYQRLRYEVMLGFLLSQEIELDKKKNGNSNYLVQKSTNPLIIELIEKIAEFGKFGDFGEDVEIFCERENIDDIDQFLKDPAQNEKYILSDAKVLPLKPVYTVTPDHIEYYKIFLYFVIKHCKPIDLPSLLNYHVRTYYSNKVEEFVKIVREIRKKRSSKKYWKHEHSSKEIAQWLYNVLKDDLDLGLYFKFSDDYQPNQHNIMRPLYNDLTKNGFIEKTRDSFKSFQYVFGVFDEIQYQTINWTGNESELKYFIQNLKKDKKIISRKIWLTCSYCILHNGEIVDDRKIGTYTITESRPTRADLLDEIINKIQK